MSFPNESSAGHKRTYLDVKVRHDSRSSGSHAGAPKQYATACLIWLPPLSSSLKNTGWLTEFRGKPILEYCVERLAQSLDWPLILVGTSEAMKRAQVFAQRFVAALYSVFSPTPIEGLAEAVSSLRVKRVILVHEMFGVELIPLEFIKELLHDHVCSGAAITMASQLPFPLYAMICERTALNKLARLSEGIPMPEHVDSAFQALLSAINKIGFCKTLKTHIKPLGTHYGVNAISLPQDLPYASSEDLTLLREAIGEEDESQPLMRLTRLRTSLVRRLEDAYRVERRPTTPRKLERSARILYASNPSAYSGGEESLVNSIRSLKGAGLSIYSLIALDGVFAERLRAYGATVHCPGENFSKPSVQNMLRMEKLLDEINPDLIHCNAAVGVPLLTIARMRRIPILQWVRVSQTEELGEHIVCADRVITVSQFVAARVLEQQPVHPTKVRVLYNCIDVDYFSPETTPANNVRYELGIVEDEFVILCVARFAPNKRHDILFRAVSVVYQKHQKIRLILVGEPQSGSGEYYKYCMSLLREVNLASVTHMLGFKEDILSVEYAADIIILCSEEEPLGRVVLEAMALGRPVIVTSSGGSTEMVEHRFNGLHSTPGDVMSLAEQILHLIEDRNLRDYLRGNARNVAVSRFSPSSHAEKLLEIYREFVQWNPVCL